MARMKKQRPKKRNAVGFTCFGPGRTLVVLHMMGMGSWSSSPSYTDVDNLSSTVSFFRHGWIKDRSYEFLGVMGQGQPPASKLLARHGQPQPRPSLSLACILQPPQSSPAAHCRPQLSPTKPDLFLQWIFIVKDMNANKSFLERELKNLNLQIHHIYWINNIWITKKYVYKLR
jgi:hypothetical protein